MLIAYALIWKQAYKQIEQINAQTPQSMDDQKRNRDMKFFKTLLIVLVLFVICRILCFMLTLLAAIDVTLYSETSHNITVFLGIVNASVNPFVYEWRNRDFRRVWYMP